ASSAYNQRRSECERATAIISEYRSIRTLAEADLADLENLRDYPLLQKRARHVISEHQRVLEAVQALERSDFQSLGALLNDSHASLKDDYEVSGKELDIIAETAQTIAGCWGARMTGAGFG